MGAFGAHALKGSLSDQMAEVYQTAASYNLFHAIGIVAISAIASRWQSRLLYAAGWLHVVGVVIFSGSLYALAMSETKWLGAITPIGGSCLIAGWLALFLAAIRRK